MHAVVSMLDDQHCERVEALWRLLATRLGLHGVAVTPFPHFSYHVAAGYALAELEPVLRGIAAETAPFSVPTAGLAMFLRVAPVVYLPVARTPPLCRFHERLWDALEAVADGVLPYYHPDCWMPHITVASGDVEPGDLPEVVRLLSGHDLAWTVPVTNLSLIYDQAGEQGLRWQIPFSGP